MPRLLSVAALCLAFALASYPSQALDQPAAKAEPAKLVRSAQSGPWSAPATWEGGKVPLAGVKVQIREGHTVTYDVRSEQLVRSLHIGGTLTFAADRDTLLNVGLIKVQPGDNTDEEGFDCNADPSAIKPGQPRPALLVGTPDRPIDASRSAVIRLHYVEGMDKASCPAIVCCGGRMDFHGAAMSRAWVKLGATATAKSKEITLAEAVTGWRAGDRIIVTATQHNYQKDDYTEARQITAINGTTITLNKPLDYEHLGTGEFRGEVANLTRNVVVESANPEGERAHTMYHRGSAGSISFAEFRHLGKKGVLGRYSLHYHLVGDTMRGSYIHGVSIWDSHNRWITIHGTNYLVVRDCVGYQSVGHGFFLEDGTEVYNVLDRNLAVAARAGKRLPKQVLPFDPNDGAGFWWANSLNTFTRNVATDNDRYGFRYEATPSSALKSLAFPILQPDGTRERVDVRTLPFVRFEDNEVHSNHGLYGINLGEGVNRVGPDVKHPFVLRNTKIWNIHYAFRPQAPCVLVENMMIHRAAYGVYHPNYDNHVYRNLTISQTNTEPFNRGHDDRSEQHGVLAVDGLTFDGCRSGGMPLIQISDDNSNGSAVSHFRNVKLTNWNDNSKARALVNLGGGPRPQPKTEKGVPIYVHDWFGRGKHAMVVSTRSPEYKANPERYREVASLTGNESRAVEVTDASFPELLKPVDDLPPATVITHIEWLTSDGKVRVRGTTSDNGTVRRVLVNDVEAKATRPNFAEWEVQVQIGRGSSITAYSADAAGNVEKLKHVVETKP